MRLPRQLPLLFCAFVLGCSDSTAGGDGEVSLLLTDAASDDLTAFAVDVTGALLRRPDGTTVSVLTSPVRVDFVELDELADLVVGRTLPGGLYAGMTLTLDFSGATVAIEGHTAPATVVDANGAPITGAVEVQITFATGSRPQVLARRNHLWTIDLDLDQSVTVDRVANRVTFVPVVSAVVDPTNQKPVRMQGALGTVDTATRTFVVQKLTSTGTVIDGYAVRTSAATLFQIDGLVSIGDAGLAALALRSGQAPRVFVQGTLDRTTRVLHAAAVETGFGVPGNGQDWVVGHIVARTGGAGLDATLTVLGHSHDVGTATLRFNTSHTVNVLRGQTKVLQRGLPSPRGTDDLNVGQRVMVFGDLVATAMDAGGAQNGVARMLPTSVFGVASGSPTNNTLTLNVARFDLRPIANFDFTVAGALEADPTAYEVDVTGLDTSGVVLNSRIRAVGFVNAVGVPADADFRALALVNRSAAANVMVCQWPAASAVAATTSTGRVAFDVTQALVKAVTDGFSTTLLQNTPTPSVVAAGTRGLYAIVQDGASEVHTSFAPFAAAVQARMTAGRRVVRVTAFGAFDVVAQQLSAPAASVIVQ